MFVPSLINPPHVLDLAPGNSLIGSLAERGLRPLLVEWGEPAADDSALDLAAHVEDRLLPLIATLGEPPLVVGYCLGGTLALAAAGAAPFAGLALLATPWHFSGFGETARAAVADLWTAAQPGCEALGLVPMELLQSGFWKLDPERTLAKYARFAAMDPDSPEAAAFVALEDWSNQGAPLTYAAGRELFDDLYDADASGRGRWRVAGRIADPAALACPAVEFVSASDRIVPAATSARLRGRRVLASGHVGMIVGARAPDTLWAPLGDWLSGHALAR